MAGRGDGRECDHARERPLQFLKQISGPLRQDGDSSRESGDSRLLPQPLPAQSGL